MQNLPPRLRHRWSITLGSRPRHAHHPSSCNSTPSTPGQHSDQRGYWPQPRRTALPPNTPTAHSSGKPTILQSKRQERKRQVPPWASLASPGHELRVRECCKVGVIDELHSPLVAACVSDCCICFLGLCSFAAVDHRSEKLGKSQEARRIAVESCQGIPRYVMLHCGLMRSQESVSAGVVAWTCEGAKPPAEAKAATRCARTATTSFKFSSVRCRRI